MSFTDVVWYSPRPRFSRCSGWGAGDGLWSVTETAPHKNVGLVEHRLDSYLCFGLIPPALVPQAPRSTGMIVHEHCQSCVQSLSNRRRDLRPRDNPSGAA